MLDLDLRAACVSLPAAPAALRLTAGLPPEGRGVVLTSPGRAPVMGLMSAAGLAAARDAAARLAPVPGLLLPGADAALELAERGAALALAALFEPDEMRGVRDGLARAVPEALLAVDARSSDLRALPWEVLGALLPGDGPLAGLHVVRASEASPRPLPGPRERLDVILACPDPLDPACGPLLRHLKALLPEARVLGEGPLPPPDPRALRVLHVISHGHRQASQIAMQRGADETAGVDAALTGLREALRGVDLVVLDTCHGADGHEDAAMVPAWRLLRQGVPACLAPQTPFCVEASRAFSAVFYAALGEGASLARATHEGRMALRAPGDPHPYSRWWVPCLLVADPCSAVTPLLRREALPQGWPEGRPSARALMARALALGQRAGWLGVEHVLMAFAEGDHAASALLQAELDRLGPDLLHRREGAGVPRLSPRMQSLAAQLRPGHGLEDLMTAVLLSAWCRVHLSPMVRVCLLQGLCRGHSTLELDSDGFSEAREGGLTLEVISGPRDGLRLQLKQPGDVLGRHDPSRDIACPVPCHDRTMSREHLVYEGGRSLRPRALTRRVTPEATRPYAGEPLPPGAVLVLGATYVEVC